MHIAQRQLYSTACGVIVLFGLAANIQYFIDE